MDKDERVENEEVARMEAGLPATGGDDTPETKQLPLAASYSATITVRGDATPFSIDALEEIVSSSLEGAVVSDGEVEVHVRATRSDT